jgi:lambda family phage portal protein
MDRHDRLEARYDAAQTVATNARHWSMADSLSADESNSPHVRSTLRTRSRYECLQANSYAKGIVHTLALDLVGSGPRLQVLTKNEAANSIIQDSFHRWMRKIKLTRKLQTMRVAKCVDGEAFAEMVTNPNLDNRVKLDLRITECEQYETPNPILDPERMISGLEFDEFGNPITYHRLQSHPGNSGFTNEKDDIPAREVIHLFRQDRPGQHRGIPEVTTALPLFAQLRRYTIAVISAAETAAKFSAVLQTGASSVTEDGDTFDPNVTPFEIADIDYDMLVSIPHGWQMNQFKPEQPMTSFREFVDSILREIARCIHMPHGIATGDASNYNYSSARFDSQTYQKAIATERQYWEEECLDRLFEAWFDEAVLIEGMIPRRLGSFEELPIKWIWGAREHVDPQKVAKAREIDLKMGLTHRAREYAILGLDVDVEDDKAFGPAGFATREEYRQWLRGSQAQESQLEEAGNVSQD